MRRRRQRDDAQQQAERDRVHRDPVGPRPDPLDHPPRRAARLDLDEATGRRRRNRPAGDRDRVADALARVVDGVGRGDEQLGLGLRLGGQGLGAGGVPREAPRAGAFFEDLVGLGAGVPREAARAPDRRRRVSTARRLGRHSRTAPTGAARSSLEDVGRPPTMHGLPSRTLRSSFLFLVPTGLADGLALKECATYRTARLAPVMGPPFSKPCGEETRRFDAGHRTSGGNPCKCARLRKLRGVFADSAPAAGLIGRRPRPRMRRRRRPRGPRRGVPASGRRPERGPGRSRFART